MIAPEKYICSNCEKLIKAPETLWHMRECNVVKLITGVIFESSYSEIPNNSKDHL